MVKRREMVLCGGDGKGVEVVWCGVMLCERSADHRPAALRARDGGDGVENTCDGGDGVR